MFFSFVALESSDTVFEDAHEAKKNIMHKRTKILMEPDCFISCELQIKK